MDNSRIKGFHEMSPEQRRRVLAERVGLSAQEGAILEGRRTLGTNEADGMVENVVGVLPVPLGVGVNMRVNSVDRLLMMAVEEPSVIAGLSNAAKRLRGGAGVSVSVSDPIMIAQIQVLDIDDQDEAIQKLMSMEDALIDEANSLDPALLEAGGGVRGIEVRVVEALGEDDPVGPMLVVHLLVDVRDAMGANAVNTMAEGLAPRIERITGGRVRLRILSNYADRRLVKATGRVPFTELETKKHSGKSVAEGIQEASVFAERDPYRAATHNKGIMNGIDALLLAAGQDFRAVEAGAHAFAARNGRYSSLSRWRVRDDHLYGELEMPMAVGTVGGVVKVHPTVRVNLKIMEIEGAADLAAMTVALGLAQNLAAIRALAVEGIQHGHMRLHARNLAIAAGAKGREVTEIVRRMSRNGRFEASSAREILARLRSEAEGH